MTLAAQAERSLRRPHLADMRLATRFLSITKGACVGDDMGGMQLGHRGQRSEFWQINLGHVLQIITMIGGLLGIGAEMIHQFDQNRADVLLVKAGQEETNRRMERMETDNSSFRAQINGEMVGLASRVDRLEWTVYGLPVRPLQGTQQPPSLFPKKH